MKIAISAESTIDLTKELSKKYDIQTVPFTILLGETEKQDGNFPTKEIFDLVRSTNQLPKTSAVNEFQYEEHFKKLLKNYDAVIHFSLSSKISCAYSNACKVARTMKNVWVIDSQSLSTGIALLAIYACGLVKENIEPEKIVKLCTKRIPFVQTSFVLEHLDYLYKGGRCSLLKLLGANLLKLRPQIIVRDGAMAPNKKFRGKFEKCVMEYCNATLEQFSNPDKEIVFITYTTADDKIIEDIKQLLTEKGFKNIYITTANGTISSHCGEHCLGILYINDGGNI